MSFPQQKSYTRFEEFALELVNFGLGAEVSECSEHNTQTHTAVAFVTYNTIGNLLCTLAGRKVICKNFDFTPPQNTRTFNPIKATSEFEIKGVLLIANSIVEQ